MSDLWLGVITLATPELIIACGAVLLLMAGVFLGKHAHSVVVGLSVSILGASGLWIFLFSVYSPTFSTLFLLDPFSYMMKFLILLCSIVTLIMSVGFSKAIKSSNTENFEYPVLVLLATLGMMLMISSNDMLGLYLSLELQSLCLYVIVAMNRKDYLSSEAGLKYFVLGAMSSGMLLYGISLIYGYTGHLNFYDIGMILKQGNLEMGMILGLVFLIAGLAFKISAAPFHMWVPDVYEGAPMPALAFIATASKVAGLAVFVRITMGIFPDFLESWKPITLFMALASMLIGSFGAIGQKNIKRLIAYASIAQIGYPLASLSTGSPLGLEGLLIHLFIYVITMLGTFSLVLGVQQHDRKIEKISDLSGISYTYPVIATALTILMFSFAGIPPLAGFWAKWSILFALVEAKLYFFACIAVLTSIVSAFYYLNIIRIIWFEPVENDFKPIAGELQLVLGVSSLFILFYVFWGDFVHKMAEAAAKAFF